MKRWYVATAIICLAVSMNAQQFGFSAQGLLTFQLQQEFHARYSDRIVSSGIAPAPGIRLEANYILQGYSFPISSFNGIGVTFIAPTTDSAIFSGRLASNSWGQNLEIIGTRRTSFIGVNLRFGYGIPHDFTEFLTIYAGMGLGWSRYKTVNVLPEESPAFQYTEEDFEEETFEPIMSRSATIEAFTGISYELERFSILAQYNFFIPIGGDDNSRLRHGASVGIFYPISDLR